MWFVDVGVRVAWSLALLEGLIYHLVPRVVSGEAHANENIPSASLPFTKPPLAFLTGSPSPDVPYYSVEHRQLATGTR